MAENPDRERELNAAVEDALRTFPLAPEPPTLLPGAMARVLRLPQRRWYHVSWLEWALGLFVVLMAGVIVWVASLWLPGDWSAWVQREGAILRQTLAANRLWAAGAGGALLLLMTMVSAAALAFSGPRHSPRAG